VRQRCREADLRQQPVMAEGGCPVHRFRCHIADRSLAPAATALELANRTVERPEPVLNCPTAGCGLLGRLTAFAKIERHPRCRSPAHACCLDRRRRASANRRHQFANDGKQAASSPDWLSGNRPFGDTRSPELIALKQSLARASLPFARKVDCCINSTGDITRSWCRRARVSCASAPPGPRRCIASVRWSVPGG